MGGDGGGNATYPHDTDTPSIAQLRNLSKIVALARESPICEAVGAEEAAGYRAAGKAVSRAQALPLTQLRARQRCCVDEVPAPRSRPTTVRQGNGGLK